MGVRGIILAVSHRIFKVNFVPGWGFRITLKVMGENRLEDYYTPTSIPPYLHTNRYHYGR